MISWAIRRATSCQAANLYRDHLRDQRQRMLQSHKALRLQYQVSLNTYKTVKLSSDLAALMKSSRKDFDALMRLRVPYLREFQNVEISRTYLHPVFSQPKVTYTIRLKQSTTLRAMEEANHTAGWISEHPITVE